MTTQADTTYHVPEQPIHTTVKPAAHGYRCSTCGATGDFASPQWLYGARSPLSAFMFCRSCVTISDVYDVLPVTEKALLKRFDRFPWKLRNDTGDACTYRVIVRLTERELGVVIYAGGRKLTCHGLKARG